jgi:hypothetical protein
LRIIDTVKDKKLLDIVYKDEPIGIGFGELQRKTGFSNDFIISCRRRLVEFGILEKDSLGYYHITKKAKTNYENGILVIPSDIRSEKHKDKKIRRDNAYTILVSKAAGGDYRYSPTLKSEYGNISMFDIKARKDVDYSGYHIPGIGLSDFFRKIKGPAMLDRRIHVGQMELFAYIDFTESEIYQYIYNLKHRKYPVLKEITMSDHKFLSYVYDIEFDNPDFIKLNREGDIMEEEKNKAKLRLVINQEEDDKLQFYHDIYYNTNKYDNIKISSKLVFDINDVKTIKVLRLDTYYKDNNYFSTSVWREPRYILEDPLLREFIITCWNILGFVLFRMNETYVYKRWPKYRVRTGNEKKSSYAYHLYMKWYKRLFGTYRFTQHNFSQLLARKRNFEKLDKRTQKEELTNAHDLISSYDNGIKENYKIIMDNKYAAIRDKYKDVVTALLDLVYPKFLRELHENNIKFYPDKLLILL